MFSSGTQSERLEIFNTKTDEVKGTLNAIIPSSPLLSIISLFCKIQNKIETRMHSSRMYTARLLTVSHSAQGGA